MKKYEKYEKIWKNIYIFKYFLVRRNHESTTPPPVRSTMVSIFKTNVQSKRTEKP
jgi:hypothetical protein